jgi:eukaryotic-like serine/threonine-protein kinase
MSLGTEASPSVVGQTIGSYSILRQLGAGAMGEVYLAEHRHLKRKAALKLLARELVGRPDLLERFFLEARATSAIAHPGIVQIFDCELDPTGRPYIVMEYLDGETLAATLSRRGPLPAITVARLTRSMAEALEAAHAKGIVHRDLKPENIFVQADPPDTVKLVDFGIAKLAGDFRAGQVHQTRSGAMMGTPLYMSPEQCRDSANIDHRTDIYSLGCVVFETLTGRPPFSHDALGDLVVAHMTAPAPDARTLNPAVAPALAELANHLLKKNPAERPSMRQVAERMLGFVGGLTTVPEAGTQPAARTGASGVKQTTFGNAAAELVADADAAGLGSRKRGPAVVALLVAAVLIGGGVFASRALKKSGGGDQVAVAPAAMAPPAPAGAPPAPAVAVPPSARAAPAVAPASPSPAADNDGRKSGGKSGDKSGDKKGRRSGDAAPALAAAGKDKPSETAPPAGETPPSPSGDLSGNWEGPWNDPGKQQKGRLFLQIGTDGNVAGWMTNNAANQSYRMLGHMTAGGHLDLACQCPRDQGFWAKGSIRASGAGEVKGQLALSSAAGVFGQSQLTLKHTSASR